MKADAFFTGVMRYSICLRLARQPSIPPSCPSLPCTRRVASRGVPVSLPVRCLSTAASDSPARERVSNFKQQRQQELREDRESEDPLYPDPYPRLKSSDDRKSAAQFLEAFSSEPSEKEVVLMGRVRSKRVVGNALIFLDVVNEFQKVQIMINKRKCVPEKPQRNRKFAVLKHLIQVGDHICRPETQRPPLSARLNGG